MCRTHGLVISHEEPYDSFLVGTSRAALDLPVLEYSDLIPEDEPPSVEVAF